MPLLAIFLTLLPALSAARADVRASLPEASVAAAIETLLTTSDPPVIGREHLEGSTLRALYRIRGGTPLWTGGRAAAALAAVRAATEEGLDPSAYHVGAISRRIEAREPRARAELDLLVSDALLHLTADVHAGRRPPRHGEPDIALEPRPLDVVQLVVAAREADDLHAYLTGLAPTHPEYRALRDALARYRALAAAGGWPTLPDGPPLEPGASDPVVPILRQRLATTGDLVGDTTETSQYDSTLQTAVRAFQRRHGITPDGVVGRTTRVALNVSAAERVAQIALNMERWRWLGDDLGSRHVLVNIAGFWLGLIEDGRPVREMPVVVGRDEWETPVFSSRITHVIFNPHWTVPTSIAREDLLPKVRKDPEYLERHGIRVYAGWERGAALVDPASIDWNAGDVDVTNLRFSQDPGPENPLGRIKFQVPNVFEVYLHDTPSRALFERPVRTYSSGCVRVGDPGALAAWLMQDMPEWNEEHRAEVLGGWDTHTVRLRTPVPVHVLYLTAWADDVVHFRRDIYRRDQALRAALRHPDEERPPAPPLQREARHATP